ncbi:competence protein ComEA [Carboxydocella thermautotrophica]|nr:competence protein ComEA [Carboxydocella thermautotrophica]
MVRKVIIGLCAGLACFLLGWQTGRLVEKEPAAMVLKADKLLNQVKLPVDASLVPAAQPLVEEEKQEQSLTEVKKEAPKKVQTRTKIKNNQQTQQVVNINQATAEELENLPGIGPALARRIVEYRNQHGLFTDKEQLLAVPGIGPKKMVELRPRVRI